MPSPLDDAEGVFKTTPSIATAQAWIDCAIEEFKSDHITLAELHTIGDAVRSWARAANIKLPEHA